MATWPPVYLDIWCLTHGIIFTDASGDPAALQAPPIILTKQPLANAQVHFASSGPCLAFPGWVAY